jgi:hypothetical protein
MVVVCTLADLRPGSVGLLVGGTEARAVDSRSGATLMRPVRHRIPDVDPDHAVEPPRHLHSPRRSSVDPSCKRSGWEALTLGG